MILQRQRLTLVSSGKWTGINKEPISASASTYSCTSLLPCVSVIAVETLIKNSFCNTSFLYHFLRIVVALIVHARHVLQLIPELHSTAISCKWRRDAKGEESKQASDWATQHDLYFNNMLILCRFRRHERRRSFWVKKTQRTWSMCHWAVMVVVDEENEVSCQLLNAKINIKLKYVIWFPATVR